MNQTDDNRDPAAACGPGCGCNTGPSGRARWVIGAIIVVITGVLIVRAVMKDDNRQTQGLNAGFASPQSSAARQTAADSAARAPQGKVPTPEAAAPPGTVTDNPPDKPVICGALIRSLGDLNSRAMDKDGVFLFLSGQDAAKNLEIAAAIEKSTATLRGRNISMGLFTLKDGSSEYASLIRQVPPPGVIAMVKGRGASGVSGDITESKLIQAFVAATSAGGCGPSGCAPSGCQ